jgi:3-oxoacyl-[acyl-carrier-protein] synthase-3
MPYTHYNTDEKNALQAMEGMAVFSFAISDVPKSLKVLHEKFNIDPEKVDYLLLHQANRFICEKMRKKANYPPEKVPYNILEYGNTSAASLPLFMVTEIEDALKTKDLELVMTGFGVGLSIGTARVKTHKIVCPDLLYLKGIYMINTHPPHAHNHLPKIHFL